MSNRGEKRIHVLTTEGHKCILNMQVTDVKKPLMSVARMCDAGHEVVFQSGGGYIKHTGSRLKVSVAQPGFIGQGPQRSSHARRMILQDHILSRAERSSGT